MNATDEGTQGTEGAAADTSGRTGTDLDINNPQKATQTRDGGSDTGAGDGKPAEGGDTGTGTEGGESSEGTEGTSSDDGTAGEDKINPTTGKPWTADEALDKFRASAKGANELLEQTKTLTGERDEANGKVAQLEKDIADLRAIAEGKNPDGLNAKDLQAKLDSTITELAVIKESTALNDFEKVEPLATGEMRESLKNLARANPEAKLQDLWDQNLKAGAVAADAARKKEADTRKKGASDQGKGTSTREPASDSDTVKGTRGDTGKTLEEFNALPVAERKALMEKYGIA